MKVGDLCCGNFDRIAPDNTSPRRNEGLPPQEMPFATPKYSRTRVNAAGDSLIKIKLSDVFFGGERIKNEYFGIPLQLEQVHEMFWT